MPIKSEVGRYFLGGALKNIILAAIVLLIVLPPMRLNFNAQCSAPLGRGGALQMLNYS
jgi:hypothetical protein